MPTNETTPDSTMYFSRSYSVPLNDCERPIVEPRAYSGNLDEEQLSTSSANTNSAGKTGHKKTLASVYRAQHKAPDLWKNSTVSDYVVNRHSIVAIKDLCGNDERIYVNGDALKHVKTLGEGAYASE